MIKDFRTFISESRGLLSGSDSCLSFARKLASFISSITTTDDYADILIVSNESCPFHDDNLDRCEYDLSGENWNLPDWASDWELVIHYVGTSGKTSGGTCVGTMETHVFIDVDDAGDDEIVSIIMHEMKHYYDALSHYKRTGSRMNFLGNTIDRIDDRISEMEDSGVRDFLSDFSYYLYCTSDTELSAWLELSRVSDRTMIDSLEAFGKLVDMVIRWRSDESVASEMESAYGVSFESYDAFKSLVMGLFGEYLSERFGESHTFERCMKSYRKIIDRNIARHLKVYGEGY